jgi:hypothetical protein
MNICKTLKIRNMQIKYIKLIPFSYLLKSNHVWRDY